MLIIFNIIITTSVVINSSYVIKYKLKYLFFREFLLKVQLLFLFFSDKKIAQVDDYRTH
jgi:hypothetical protein